MSQTQNERCIDYIEFNVSDISASKAFYGKAFGWTFKDYGPHYCEFSDGRMTGGFSEGEPVKSSGALIVIYDSDLPDAIKRIKSAGGTITKPVFEFPGGRRFHFTDPDGYELAVWAKAATSENSQAT